MLKFAKRNLFPLLTAGVFLLLNRYFEHPPLWLVCVLFGAFALVLEELDFMPLRRRIDELEQRLSACEDKRELLHGNEAS